MTFSLSQIFTPHPLKNEIKWNGPGCSGNRGPQPHFLGLLLSPTRAASGCLWNFQIQSERHEQDPGLSDEALPAEVPGFHLFLPLKSAVVSSEGVGAAVHLVSQGWNEMQFSRLEGREKPLAPVSSKWHALQVHGAGAPRGTD